MIDYAAAASKTYRYLFGEVPPPISSITVLRPSFSQLNRICGKAQKPVQRGVKTIVKWMGL